MNVDKLLAEIAQAQRATLDPQIPPAEPSRARLVRRMKRTYWPFAIAAVCAVLFAVYRPSVKPGMPDSNLTPGAVLSTATRESVCAANDETRMIPASMAGEVFRRYDIQNPKPRDFEVDYLIPPDLGGSTEPRNLWPQPYATGVWNSHVKDALEDRLRVQVCSGQLDLAAAQRELAADWIAAYKRHFRTQEPLFEHAAFSRDPAWE